MSELWPTATHIILSIFGSFLVAANCSVGDGLILISNAAISIVSVAAVPNTFVSLAGVIHNFLVR